jgi:hypothetical protein
MGEPESVFGFRRRSNNSEPQRRIRGIENRYDLDLFSLSTRRYYTNTTTTKTKRRRPRLCLLSTPYIHT